VLSRRERQRFKEPEVLRNDFLNSLLAAYEAELKALKEEFKARGLDRVEGKTSTVTASETFQKPPRYGTGSRVPL
jgi:hypothetical protein